MGVMVGAVAAAGAMPGERIATRILTNDGIQTVAEDESMIITPTLVEGRTYRVWFYGHVNSSVATDDAATRIREDDINGAELQSDRVDIAGSSTSGRKSNMEIEWLAPVTGPKSFALTIVRSTGTGNVFIEAGSNRPAIFACDFVR